MLRRLSLAPLLLLTSCQSSPPIDPAACGSTRGLSRSSQPFEPWETERTADGRPALNGLPVFGPADAREAAGFRIGDAAFPDQAAFIAAGRRCGTATPPGAVAGQVERDLRAFRVAPGAADFVGVGFNVEVPVWFHIITCGGEGDVSQSVIDEQLRVLNAAFNNAGVWFVLAGVDRTESGRWYTMGYGSPEERQAKAALGKDTARNLNIYLAAPPGGLLGWATFPWDLAADPSRDGVVLLNRALPGGTPPYNLGATGTHEVGHWLGLYHTFQDGCGEPNDYVTDTPPEAGPHYGCPGNTDTCPSPGEDNNDNYMSYVDDPCMILFTPGQTARLRQMVSIYRPGLGPTNQRSTAKLDSILPPAQ